MKIKTLYTDKSDKPVNPKLYIILGFFVLFCCIAGTFVLLGY